MAEQLSARDLFRAAYENRYTWDQNFPGYTADIQLRQGDQVFNGTIRISPELTAEVSGVDDAAAKKSIQEQAWEIAVHRVRRPFEVTHGQNTFEYGATDASGAVEIIMGGKAAGDRYKVKDNVVTLVHRHIHGTVVTINTFSTHQTEAGYLSHCYDSVYHDPNTGTQVKGPYQFEDLYEKVGDYYILTRRTITGAENGQPLTTEFAFSNIRLLAPVLA